MFPRPFGDVAGDTPATHKCVAMETLPAHTLAGNSIELMPKSSFKLLRYSAAYGYGYFRVENARAAVTMKSGISL